MLVCLNTIFEKFIISYKIIITDKYSASKFKVWHKTSISLRKPAKDKEEKKINVDIYVVESIFL